METSLRPALLTSSEILKTKPFLFYSNGCAFQNRNVTIFANALQHNYIMHSMTIYQKYLVTGHTQMECDSVHATIERKKKNKELDDHASNVFVLKKRKQFIAILN